MSLSLRKMDGGGIREASMEAVCQERLVSVRLMGAVPTLATWGVSAEARLPDSGLQAKVAHAPPARAFLPRVKTF